MDKRIFFREQLLLWHQNHHRPMPWKGERDPYKIWLSEIILQQTRVQQGMAYYENLLAAYPDIRRLAEAPEDELLKHWEGLGYYSRARNLHATARYIAEECGGKFPDTYEAIRQLKGVGDYTAAAIASFAYDLPHAVLDGNVYRILARFFGLDTPIDTPAAKKVFGQLADALLDTGQPGAYNQAIMDFGATACVPKSPDCGACPLHTQCEAFRSGRVAALPIKSKKLAKTDRYFVYAVFYHREHIWVHQRGERDIWQNLYEFPLLELAALPADTGSLPALLLSQFFPGGAPPGTRLRGISKPYRQTLSHRVVTAVFCEFDFPEKSKSADIQNDMAGDFQKIEHFKLKKILAVPRVIDWFWQEKDITLRFI
ncbi:MAG: A/G-specific adenine glycosylase [Saprospiraceae bacterium]|nr:A/G-specific adenine glycosylase [Saprospiraceae bacterium]